MKLKKILENMNKMPSTLGGFNESPKLSPEQKRKLMEMVSNYNQLGQKLKMENSLIETAQALSEITELAETYACNESQDWFATEVVKTDFKRARGISETFQKVAKECHGRVQQLNALYEDMGNILNRYYEIADPMMEVCPNPANIGSQRGLPNQNPQTVMEVKPNDSNLQSQRELPANSIVKEVAIDDKNTNIKSQRDLPSGGPAPAQLKEVSPNDKNVKSQRCLPAGGPAPAQIKEIAPNDKNVKSQRELPHTNEPATPQLKEVSPNTSNLQSQKDLPSGGPSKCPCSAPTNPSIPVNPAGAGECNVKGERDAPQGGPASAQIKETYPTMKEIMGIK
jgi:hypothetical protein